MNQQQAGNTAGRFISALQRIEAGDRAAIDSLAGMFADDAQLSNPIIERQGSRFKSYFDPAQVTLRTGH
jgi:hypothetical protein